MSFSTSNTGADPLTAAARDAGVAARSGEAAAPSGQANTTADSTSANNVDMVRTRIGSPLLMPEANGHARPGPAGPGRRLLRGKTRGTRESHGLASVSRRSVAC